MWWVSTGKKHCSWWCALSAQKVTGGTNRCQCQSGKGFQSACGTARSVENLINALKLLANWQKDGDSPIQSIVTGLVKEADKE